MISGTSLPPEEHSSFFTQTQTQTQTQKSVSEVILSYADIFQIHASNPQIDQHIYFIDYIDEHIIRAIDTTLFTYYYFDLKHGQFLDTSITSLSILYHKLGGVVEKLGLKKHQWIDLWIGLDIPCSITGKITHIEYDRITLELWNEFGTHENIIFLDFAYKGLPWIPRMFLTIREPPGQLRLRTQEDRTMINEEHEDEDKDKKEKEKEEEEEEEEEDSKIWLTQQMMEGCEELNLTSELCTSMEFDSTLFDFGASLLHQKSACVRTSSSHIPPNENKMTHIYSFSTQLSALLARCRRLDTQYNMTPEPCSPDFMSGVPSILRRDSDAPHLRHLTKLSEEQHQDIAIYSPNIESTTIFEDSYQEDQQRKMQEGGMGEDNVRHHHHKDVKQRDMESLQIIQRFQQLMHLYHFYVDSKTLLLHRQVKHVSVPNMSSLFVTSLEQEDSMLTIPEHTSSTLSYTTYMNLWKKTWKTYNTFSQQIQQIQEHQEFQPTMDWYSTWFPSIQCIIPLLPTSISPEIFEHILQKHSLWSSPIETLSLCCQVISFALQYLEIDPKFVETILYPPTLEDIQEGDIHKEKVSKFIWRDGEKRDGGRRVQCSLVEGQRPTSSQLETEGQNPDVCQLLDGPHDIKMSGGHPKTKEGENKKNRTNQTKTKTQYESDLIDHHTSTYDIYQWSKHGCLPIRNQYLQEFRKRLESQDKLHHQHAWNQLLSSLQVYQSSQLVNDITHMSKDEMFRTMGILAIQRQTYTTFLQSPYQDMLDMILSINNLSHKYETLYHFITCGKYVREAVISVLHEPLIDEDDDNDNDDDDATEKKQTSGVKGTEHVPIVKQHQPGDNEHEAWLYCIDTHLPLLPRFLYECAKAYYEGGYERLCQQWMILRTKENVIWIDRMYIHIDSGWEIQPLITCMTPFYSTHTFLPLRIKEPLEEIDIHSLTKHSSISEDMEHVIQDILSTICSEIGISCTSYYDQIMYYTKLLLPTISPKSSFSLLSSTLTSSDKKLQNEIPQRPQKQELIYKRYYSTSLITSITAALLVTLQLKKQIGRNKDGKKEGGGQGQRLIPSHLMFSIEGYPITSSDNMKGIEYFTSILKQMKTKYGHQLPPHQLFSTNILTIPEIWYYVSSSQIQEECVLHVTTLFSFPEIRHLYMLHTIQEKKNLSKRHNLTVNRIWPQFLPIANTSAKLYPIPSSTFYKEFMIQLRGGHRYQEESFGLYLGKFGILTSSIVHGIQQQFHEHPTIHVTMDNVPTQTTTYQNIQHLHHISKIVQVLFQLQQPSLFLRYPEDDFLRTSTSFLLSKTEQTIQEMNSFYQEFSQTSYLSKILQILDTQSLSLYTLSFGSGTSLLRRRFGNPKIPNRPMSPRHQDVGGTIQKSERDRTLSSPIPPNGQQETILSSDFMMMYDPTWTMEKKQEMILAHSLPRHFEYLYMYVHRHHQSLVMDQLLNDPHDIKMSKGQPTVEERSSGVIPPVCEIILQKCKEKEKWLASFLRQQNGHIQFYLRGFRYQEEESSISHKLYRLFSQSPYFVGMETFFANPCKLIDQEEKEKEKEKEKEMEKEVEGGSKIQNPRGIWKHRIFQRQQRWRQKEFIRTSIQSILEIYPMAIKQQHQHHFTPYLSSYSILDEYTQEAIAPWIHHRSKRIIPTQHVHEWMEEQNSEVKGVPIQDNVGGARFHKKHLTQEITLPSNSYFNSLATSCPHSEFLSYIISFVDYIYEQAKQDPDYYEEIEEEIYKYAWYATLWYMLVYDDSISSSMTTIWESFPIPTTIYDISSGSMEKIQEQNIPLTVLSNHTHHLYQCIQQRRIDIVCSFLQIEYHRKCI
jgi:hypothetical protein